MLLRRIRLFIQEKRYDRVLEGVAEAARRTAWGQGSGWRREMGHEVLNNYLETKAVCMAI